MTQPVILAFDTSGPYCAAALLCAGDIVARETVPMARGQAEALMPLLERTLSTRNLVWSDLDALAVGIGPGNFTGIRISVAAARGLALALGCPAIGVSNFEVMAFECNHIDTLVCLAAPRDRVYVQRFHGGAPADAPRLIDLLASKEGLDLPIGTWVIGHRAGEIGPLLGVEGIEAAPRDIPGQMAQIAATRFADGDFAERPAPLYVRAADAAPPSDPPPVILP